MRLKNITFNKGSIFTRPYQSDTAMLRHFLISNAGVPYSYIEQELRRQIPEGGTINRIKKLCYQLSINSAERLHYLRQGVYRQCPQCASQLYHSDLFNLPWLMRCPIHNCAFTTDCPKCERPWPNNQELLKRECSLCGLFQLSRKMPTIELISRKNIYATLSQIYDFIRYKSNNECHLLSIEGPDWWHSITINHKLFPACRLDRYPQVKKKKLDTSGIHFTTVRKKIGRISKPCTISTSKSRLNHGYMSPNKNGRRLRSYYEIFKVILVKLRAAAEKSHVLKIQSYRHLGMQNLIRAPRPCPFCMALSLWLYHTASWDYQPKHHIGTDYYPFALELGYHTFYAPIGYTHIADSTKYYKLNSSLSSWTYKRSLELSFVDILRFTLFVCDQWERYQTQKYNPYCHDEYGVEERDFSDLSYCLDCSSSATIYYENEHPVDQMVSPKTRMLTSQCQSFQRHLRSIIDAIIHLDAPPVTEDITYNQFIDLKQIVIESCMSLGQEYSPGSFPIRFLSADHIRS